MAGLIAARMLSDQFPKVLEKQPSLPNNHAALLRFRSSVVGDVTNIPFRKVEVSKAVVGGMNPAAAAVAYSKKVTGRLTARSILNVEPSTRYIAPPDLVSRLALTADIEYGKDFLEWSPNLHRDDCDFLISTLPMPYMMDLFEWPDKPDFKYSAGWSGRGKLKPELQSTVNCTVYSPSSEPWYRASINDEDVIFEGVHREEFTPDEIVEALESLFGDRRLGQNLQALGVKPEDLVDGLTFKTSHYQKISDLTPQEAESAKRFVMWLSTEKRIFSLGRFATWRPKLMLDDVVNDVRVIQRLIAGQSHYEEVVGK